MHAIKEKRLLLSQFYHGVTALQTGHSICITGEGSLLWW